MRLNHAQKEAVLLSVKTMCGDVVDPHLVRVANTWACVWREPARPAKARWRGQLVKEVRQRPDTGRVSDLDGRPFDVWWTSSEVGGPTRKMVVQELTAEAMR